VPCLDGRWLCRSTASVWLSSNIPADHILLRTQFRSSSHNRSVSRRLQTKHPHRRLDCSPSGLCLQVLCDLIPGCQLVSYELAVRIALPYRSRTAESRRKIGCRSLYFAQSIAGSFLGRWVVQCITPNQHSTKTPGSYKQQQLALFLTAFVPNSQLALFGGSDVCCVMGVTTPKSTTVHHMSMDPRRG